MMAIQSLLGDLPLIQVVLDRQKRVVQHHPWPRIAHHPAHLLAHFVLVAVHRTLGAGGFLRLEWAFFDALHRIIVQFLAFSAQFPGRLVAAAAVELDHQTDRAPLSL
jgi:hypothetical protein